MRAFLALMLAGWTAAAIVTAPDAGADTIEQYAHRNAPVICTLLDTESVGAVAGRR